MKNELPRFLVQATQFIDPLFHSFYYMQLNIFYLLLEKLNTFAEGKFDVSTPAAQIAADYEARRSDALERIEALNIAKRFISTCTYRSRPLRLSSPPNYLSSRISANGAEPAGSLRQRRPAVPRALRDPILHGLDRKPLPSFIHVQEGASSPALLARCLWRAPAVLPSCGGI